MRPPAAPDPPRCCVTCNNSSNHPAATNVSCSGPGAAPWWNVCGSIAGASNNARMKRGVRLKPPLPPRPPVVPAPRRTWSSRPRCTRSWNAWRTRSYRRWWRRWRARAPTARWEGACCSPGGRRSGSAGAQSSHTYCAVTSGGSRDSTGTPTIRLVTLRTRTVIVITLDWNPCRAVVATTTTATIITVAVATTVTTHWRHPGNNSTGATTHHQQLPRHRQHQPQRWSAVIRITGAECSNQVRPSVS